MNTLYFSDALLTSFQSITDEAASIIEEIKEVFRPVVMNYCTYLFGK